MDDIERERLTSEIATLRLLLEVNEIAAVDQARRADRALESVKREAEGRAEHAKLVHEIIEASSDAVIVLDNTWEFRYVNRRAADDIFAGQQMVGTNLLRDFPEIIPTAFYQRYQKAMDERVPVVFEDFYAPQERWMAVSVSPVGNGIAIFFRDVTERRQREAAMHKTEKLAAVGPPRLLHLARDQQPARVRRQPALPHRASRILPRRRPHLRRPRLQRTRPR